jgi:hypothetical protein
MRIRLKREAKTENCVRKRCMVCTLHHKETRLVGHVACMGAKKTAWFFSGKTGRKETIWRIKV